MICWSISTFLYMYVVCMCRTLFCGLHEKVCRNTAMKNVFTLIIYFIRLYYSEQLVLSTCIVVQIQM